MKIRQVSLAISVAILLLFGLFARGGNVTADKALTSRVPCAPKIWNNTIYSQDSSRICPDVMDYQIRATAVDEQSGNFILRLIPKPRGMYGVAMSSSGVASRAFSVDYDSNNSTRINVSDSGVSQGVLMQESYMGSKNFLFYPFDRYSGQISFHAIDSLTKGDIPGVFTVVNTSLAGWNTKFTQDGKPVKDSHGKVIQMQGPIVIHWYLQRANVEILSVLILMLLLLIALASSYSLTRSIFRKKRPPSMGLLLWLATLLFAILQVRGNFPGNPPLGLLIDYLVFFPVLGLLLILGISNTVMWISRPDWDLENEHFLESF